MQQFRVTLLDDEDNIIMVEYESETFDTDDKSDAVFGDAVYRELLELNRKYNLVDYENAPPMEFQRRVTDKNGGWGEWKYMSDPIVDYYNL